MNRALLTPFVIAGLLLLPSCSSDKPNACEAAVKSSDEYFAEGKKQNKLENYDLSRPALIRSAKIVVNNPECFKPAWVAESQIYLDDVNKPE
jgi:hypothetical protein